MIRTGQTAKVVTIAGLGHWPQALPAPTSSCASMAARCRWASCAPWCRRRPTPGSPRSSDYGTMSFGDVAAAAIRFAREGFAVYAYMATMIAAVRGRLSRAGRRTPRSSCPAARSPQVGDRFVQTDLAGTLQYMVDQERAAAARGREAGLAAARDAFYRGDIAETIVALPRAERRLSGARRSRELPQPLRGAGQGRAGATSRSTPAARGARGRCWCRRCACSRRRAASRVCSTTAPTTCTCITEA